MTVRVHEPTSEEIRAEACTYCGEPADTKDHTVPWSYFTNERRKGTGRAGPGELVPACRDCNTRLGSVLRPAIQDRADYVAEALVAKYSDVLKSKPWDDEELDELGPGLRARIEQQECLRRTVSRRLDYLDAVSRGLINP